LFIHCSESLLKVGLRENMAMRSIVKAASTLTEPGTETPFQLPLKLSALYPKFGLDYFVTYHGSLTTPTCDEKVHWTVFLEPIEISEQQVRKTVTPDNLATVTKIPAISISIRKKSF